MELAIEKVDVDSLLLPFKQGRQKYTSYLYSPYSIKLHRRVNVYTKDGYALWTRLESNPSVVRYNELVKPIPISISKGKAQMLSPGAISIHIANLVCVHLIEGKEEKTAAWNDWCQETGYTVVEWDKKELYKNPIELNNLQKLLRLTSDPNFTPHIGLENSILQDLKNYSSIPFFKLVKQFHSHDENDVHRVIAYLIINKKIFSDIHINVFSMFTELSAHHEFG